MRIEVSKPTLKYLINKYPQLTDNIIQYFLFIGKIENRYYEGYKLNKFKHMFNSHHVLIIPKYLAQEYGVDMELELIPDEDGVIYKIYINE